MNELEAFQYLSDELKSNSGRYDADMLAALTQARACLEKSLGSYAYCPNDDHVLDFDDGDSAYYLGGHASLEDYRDAQEWEAYDPYDPQWS